MSIRIRVYPQNGAAGGLGGYGGMGGFGATNTRVRLSQQQLKNERKTANMQLQYERALWSEKLKFVQLQAQVQNPYQAYRMGGLGGFGNSLGGAFGMGASPFGMGGSPFGMANPMAMQSTGFMGSMGLGSFF